MFAGAPDAGGFGAPRIPPSGAAAGFIPIGPAPLLGRPMGTFSRLPVQGAKLTTGGSMPKKGSSSHPSRGCGYT